MAKRLIIGIRETRKVYLVVEHGHNTEKNEILPDRSRLISNHSPDGFNWGYSGSGPAQLALAIMLLFLDNKQALKYYMDFKFEIIAELPTGDFVLPVALVQAWLKDIGAKI